MKGQRIFHTCWRRTYWLKSRQTIRDDWEWSMYIVFFCELNFFENVWFLQLNMTCWVEIGSRAINNSWISILSSESTHHFYWWENQFLSNVSRSNKERKFEFWGSQFPPCIRSSTKTLPSFVRELIQYLTCYFIYSVFSMCILHVLVSR